MRAGRKPRLSRRRSSSISSGRARTKRRRARTPSSNGSRRCRKRNEQREAALREKEAALERAQDEQKRRARTEKAQEPSRCCVGRSSPSATLLLGVVCADERRHAEALLTSAKPIVAGAEYQMDDAGRTGGVPVLSGGVRIRRREFDRLRRRQLSQRLGRASGLRAGASFPAQRRNEGDRNAMDNLGSIYDSGEAAKQGFAQDFAKAREWYERAARAGNVSSMVNLGRLYDSGRGVAPDYAQAREWYVNAAKNGQRRRCSPSPRSTKTARRGCGRRRGRAIGTSRRPRLAIQGPWSGSARFTSAGGESRRTSPRRSIGIAAPPSRMIRRPCFALARSAKRGGGSRRLRRGDRLV